MAGILAIEQVTWADLARQSLAPPSRLEEAADVAAAKAHGRKLRGSGNPAGLLKAWVFNKKFRGKPLTGKAIRAFYIFSQTTISKDLVSLERLGLVERDTSGQPYVYRITERLLKAPSAAIQAIVNIGDLNRPTIQDEQFSSINQTIDDLLSSQPGEELSVTDRPDIVGSIAGTLLLKVVYRHYPDFKNEVRIATDAIVAIRENQGNQNPLNDVMMETLVIRFGQIFLCIRTTREPRYLMFRIAKEPPQSADQGQVVAKHAKGTIIMVAQNVSENEYLKAKEEWTGRLMERLDFCKKSHAIFEANDWKEQVELVKILKQSSASAAIPKLIELFKITSPYSFGGYGLAVEFRSTIAEALRSWAAVEDAGKFILALRDKSAVIRALAAAALGHMETIQSRNALSQAFQDPDPTVRIAALVAFSGFKQLGNAGLVANMLNDSVPEVRRAASAALKTLQQIPGSDNRRDEFLRGFSNKVLLTNLGDPRSEKDISLFRKYKGLMGELTQWVLTSALIVSADGFVIWTATAPGISLKSRFPLESLMILSMYCIFAGLSFFYLVYSYDFLRCVIWRMYDPSSYAVYMLTRYKYLQGGVGPRAAESEAIMPRAVAIDYAIKRGPAVIDELLEAMDDVPNDNAGINQAAAMSVIMGLGRDAVDPLIRALSKSEPNLFYNGSRNHFIINALGKLGDKRALEPLMRLNSFGDEYWDKITRSAIEKLGVPATTGEKILVMDGVTTDLRVLETVENAA